MAAPMPREAPVTMANFPAWGSDETGIAERWGIVEVVGGDGEEWAGMAFLTDPADVMAFSLNLLYE